MSGAIAGSIRASLEQYFSLGQYLWAGHTYAQLASMAAVVGFDRARSRACIRYSTLTLEKSQSIGTCSDARLAMRLS